MVVVLRLVLLTSRVCGVHDAGLLLQRSLQPRLPPVIPGHGRTLRLGRGHTTAGVLLVAVLVVGLGLVILMMMEVVLRAVVLVVVVVVRVRVLAAGWRHVAGLRRAVREASRRPPGGAVLRGGRLRVHHGACRRACARAHGRVCAQEIACARERTCMRVHARVCGRVRKEGRADAFVTVPLREGACVGACAQERERVRTWKQRVQGRGACGGVRVCVCVCACLRVYNVLCAAGSLKFPVGTLLSAPLHLHTHRALFIHHKPNSVLPSKCILCLQPLLPPPPPTCSPPFPEASLPPWALFSLPPSLPPSLPHLPHPTQAHLPRPR